MQNEPFKDLYWVTFARCFSDALILMSIQYTKMITFTLNDEMLNVSLLPWLLAPLFSWQRWPLSSGDKLVALQPGAQVTH